MRIERVYLAGGINGLTDSAATDWRSLVKALLPRNIAVIDPMARDYRGKEDENVEAIVNGDLADIKSCQAIIANCPRPSWGTASELQWNHDNRAITEYHPAGYDNEYGAHQNAYHSTVGYRRCVAVVPDEIPVSPWLRHNVDAVVGTIEEAVDLVLDWWAE